MLHDGSKDECAHKRYAQRIGNGTVVLIESVFIDTQVEPPVQVFEEDAAHVVALADHDGVLFAQLLQVGKGGTEHRVG